MYVSLLKNILGHEVKKFKGHFNFFTEKNKNKNLNNQEIKLHKSLDKPIRRLIQGLVMCDGIGNRSRTKCLQTKN